MVSARLTDQQGLTGDVDPTQATNNPRSKPPTTLLNLPDELFAHIFEYSTQGKRLWLPRSKGASRQDIDMLNPVRLNRRIRRICRPSFLRVITIPHDDDGVRLAHILADRASRCSVIDLAIASYGTAILAFVSLAGFSNLRTLNIVFNILSPEVLMGLSSLSHLVRLELAGKTIAYRDAEAEEPLDLRLAGSVRQLVISRWEWSNTPSRLPLQRLTLDFPLAKQSQDGFSHVELVKVLSSLAQTDVEELALQRLPLVLADEEALIVPSVVRLVLHELEYNIEGDGWQRTVLGDLPTVLCLFPNLRRLDVQKAQYRNPWPIQPVDNLECAQDFPTFFALLYLLACQTEITEIRIHEDDYSREVRWTRDLEETEWSCEQYELETR